MPIIEVINEKPIAMVELKSKLDGIEKRDGSLNFRAKKAKDYLDQFATMKISDANNIRERLNALGIPRLRERHVDKIIDINPKDIESLKIILSGETLTLKQDELAKIFDAIKEK
ncbi:hypothetical protein J4231_02065 [Candidatus Woesearchaeota archaeon]|nr:hypothetical protein [Candidatus Woesearchaeota archaeon]